MALDMENWLDTATSGIRFGPDRAAVRAELQAHIEDREADLRRIFPDIPQGEARARALAGMGDPEEIKTELARVHRPWLGWLWRLSQMVLVLSVVLLMLSAERWSSGWFEPSAGRDWSGAVRLEPSGQRAEIGGYTISMTRAGAWREEDGAWIVGVDLRMTSPRFWALEGQSLCRCTSAVDSLGNTYYSDDQWSRLDPSDYPSPMRWVRGSPLGRMPFRRDYGLSVSGVDPGARWIRLEYEWLGNAFSMTIETAAWKEAGT